LLIIAQQKEFVYCLLWVQQVDLDGIAFAQIHFVDGSVLGLVQDIPPRIIMDQSTGIDDPVDIF
jgi:hypothetical protein